MPKELAQPNVVCLELCDVNLYEFAIFKTLLINAEISTAVHDLLQR